MKAMTVSTKPATVKQDWYVVDASGKTLGRLCSELARRLMKNGITNVFNLEGSIFQWANEGRALAGTNGPAAKVHPYNDRWGALLKPEVRATAK